MIVILSHWNKTPKNIGERMRELGIECNVLLGKFHHHSPGGLLVRWGSTIGINHDGPVLNKPEAIRLASNKLETIKLLGDLAPTIYREDDVYPIIGRPIKHSKGNKFYVCHNKDEYKKAVINGAECFTYFFDKEKEYRVHVGSGKTLLVSIKEGGDTDKISWNKKNGFNFRHMHRHEWLENEFLKSMLKSCKEAVKKVGLDFGAVDVMTAEGKFIILEINTAPALSPLAIDKYIGYFKLCAGL